MKKIKKTIFIMMLIILLAMSMGGMYYFSSQDGSTSSVQSNMVIDIIEEIRDKVTLKNEELIKIKDTIINNLRGYNKSLVVRKAAHFGIYATIGGTMMIIIYLLSKQIIFSACISFTLTFLYAVFDEKRQLGVTGRSGSLRDVFIDSSGALLAISILAFIFMICKSINFILKKSRKGLK